MLQTVKQAALRLCGYFTAREPFPLSFLPLFVLEPKDGADKSFHLSFSPFLSPCRALLLCRQMRDTTQTPHHVSSRPLWENPLADTQMASGLSHTGSQERGTHEGQPLWRPEGKSLSLSPSGAQSHQELKCEEQVSHRHTSGGTSTGRA